MSLHVVAARTRAAACRPGVASRLREPIDEASFERATALSIFFIERNADLERLPISVGLKRRLIKLVVELGPHLPRQVALFDEHEVELGAAIDAVRRAVQPLVFLVVVQN